MKKLLILSTVLMFVAGCTHSKVDVSQVNDANKTCSQITTELAQLDSMENDIDKKTGFSGRNVGMALLFWPGVIVNEMNASDAEDRIRDRKNRLVQIHSDKSCS